MKGHAGVWGDQRTLDRHLGAGIVGRGEDVPVRHTIHGRGHAGFLGPDADHARQLQVGQRADVQGRYLVHKDLPTTPHQHPYEAFRECGVDARGRGSHGG